MIKKVIPISLFILLLAKIIYSLIADFDELKNVQLLGMGLELFISAYLLFIIASEKYIDFLDGFKMKHIKKD